MSLNLIPVRPPWAFTSLNSLLLPPLALMQTTIGHLMDRPQWTQGTSMNTKHFHTCRAAILYVPWRVALEDLGSQEAANERVNATCDPLGFSD